MNKSTGEIKRIIFPAKKKKKNALYLFETQRIAYLLGTQSRIAPAIINTDREPPNLIDNQPITPHQG